MSNSASGGPNKKALERIFNSFFEWEKHGFQHSVVENAAQRFKNRVIGWYMHNNLWTDDADTAEFGSEWQAFEKKHLKGYCRWKKLAHVKGGFDLNSKDFDFEKRVQKLFLFYLVYGEINDFRNMKNVLNLFYHNSLERYEQNAPHPKLGEWIRLQGQNLYRLLGLVYSNNEMNQQCFHHDDLDDLCASQKFVKRWMKEKDFLIAFGVAESEANKGKKSNIKFPYMAKLLSEPQDVFIKFWLRSTQAGLTEDDRNARESWTKQHFWDDKVKENDKNNLTTMEEQYQKIQNDLKGAQEARRMIEENNKSSDRPYHPTESEFEDRDTFLSAWTNFETSKELFLVAEKSFKDAESKLSEARSAHFRSKVEAIHSFQEASTKFKEAEHDFSECVKGFDRAITGFQALQPKDLVQFQLTEAQLFRERANWLAVSAKERQLKTDMSRLLQFRFEDVLNQERVTFAKKWKTFFEKAGGPGGLSGYFTIFTHYSTVIFLHFWMMIPVVFLYFGYDSIMETVNNAGDVNWIMNTSHPLIFAAIPIVFLVIFAIILILTRFRTSGYSSPRRDAGTKMVLNFRARFATFLLWFFVIITELVYLKYLILDPIKTATESFLQHPGYVSTPILLILHWLPVVILYFYSIQFVFSLWIGVFGWIYGLIDGVAKVRTWSDLQGTFDESLGQTPTVITAFHRTMMPHQKNNKNEQDPEELKRRQTMAFAKVWNEIIRGFYDLHKLSKEEWQNYSYKIKNYDSSEEFLAGVIEKKPNLTSPPKVKDVRYHLIKYVNNVMMKKPTKNISVREMLPLTIVTPVGAEKILYPYEYITHVDNTQNSFLQHLIQKQPEEWANFVRKEGNTPKALDFLTRLEKDILQGVQPDQSRKRWIHNHKDGIELKLKLCEWGSLRFQALYRTVHGFMQLQRALVTMARIQEPTMTLVEAEELVRMKFSYVVGYQSFGQAYKTYKKTKSAAQQGAELNKKEMDAHDAVYHIKYIKRKFPMIRIAYPDFEDGKYIGRLTSGTYNGVFFNYTTELFGPFVDLGLGKPTHQNFLSQFIDGLVIQTIDVNQDNMLSQSLFVPNVLSEFEKDKRIKIVGCPEFVFTEDWSSTAWCSAFTEHTFGTLVQRTYARLNIRLHYGHPDYIDALWVMTETGLSKMPYVSEDIFTGFDTVIKGGKIVHVEYHEVGKARDVDLYTTTKFIRKISMGASQMACTRYIQQLQTSKNVSFLQRLCYYYSTVGFYLNHLILYMSVWFALVTQVLLVIFQKYIFEGEVSDFMVNRVFVLQVGMALVIPGVIQLILENGLFLGLWAYIRHFLIVSVYSTFHILNTSSYWQWGLVKTAFYLASGRGSGLEHYFMKDMYNTFYSTHWRAGFIILWLGVLWLCLSGNWLVFFVMYVLPAGIWLWGAMFLNPGALPSSVHEEQWKRLMNRDMIETDEIVREHTKRDVYYKPPQGNAFKRFFIRIGQRYSRFVRFCHWVYTSINFAVHTRVIRFLAVLTMGFELIFSRQIPTFIFTDDRRRILRWDEEDTRAKSIFYSNMANKSNDSPIGGTKVEAPKKTATRSTSLAMSPDVNMNKQASSRRLMFVDQDRPGTLRRNEKLSVEEVTVKKSAVKKPLPVAPSGPSSDSGFPDLRKARVSADSEVRKLKKKRDVKPLPVKPDEDIPAPVASATRERSSSSETRERVNSTENRPRSASKEAPLPPAKPLPQPGERHSVDKASDSEAPVRPRSRSGSRGTDDRHKVIKMKKDLPIPPSDSDVNKN